MQIDTGPARIIELIPKLAKNIEDSNIDEKLSRFCNRIALADFYCAYRAAQDKPGEFLHELGQVPFPIYGPAPGAKMDHARRSQGTLH